MNDYNFEMTGRPSDNELATYPDLANAWYAFSGESPAPAPTTPPVWLRPEDYVSNNFAAPYTQAQITAPVDPSTIRQGAGGVSYAGLTGTSNYYDPTNAGEYVVNPQTNRFVLDKNGNPVPVPRPNDPNSFGSTIADVIIPTAIALGSIPVVGGITGQAFGALGAMGEALPYTEAYDVANLYANGITNAGQLGDIMASTGMDPFLAADMGNLAAQGLSAEQIAQVMGYSYTPAELAGTGMTSFLPAALSGGAGAATGAAAGSVLGNVAKGALLATALRAANKTGVIGSSGSGSSPFGSLAGTNMNLPGVIRGNETPFVFSKELPVQDVKTASYNPFEALNVKETVPNLPINSYAQALRG